MVWTLPWTRPGTISGTKYNTALSNLTVDTQWWTHSGQVIRKCQGEAPNSVGRWERGWGEIRRVFLQEVASKDVRIKRFVQISQTHPTLVRESETNVSLRSGRLFYDSIHLLGVLKHPWGVREDPQGLAKLYVVQCCPDHARTRWLVVLGKAQLIPELSPFCSGEEMLTAFPALFLSVIPSCCTYAHLLYLQKIYK